MCWARSPFPRVRDLRYLTLQPASTLRPKHRRPLLETLRSSGCAGLGSELPPQGGREDPGTDVLLKLRIANLEQSTLLYHFHAPTWHLDGGLARWGLRSSWWWHEMPAICTPRLHDRQTLHTIAQPFSFTCLPCPSQFVTANIVEDSESTTLGIQEANKVFILPFRRITTLPLCTR